MMLRSEVFRARFAKSFEKPEALTPGKPTRLQFELLDVLHRFKKGHRLRLEISNGDSPITDSIFTHQYSWFKVGRDTIHHGQQYASRLIVPVVSESRQ